MIVLKKPSFVRFAMLSLFSRPAHERAIYRMIRHLRAATIVEIGVQEGVGSQRIIEAALRSSPAEEIRYTGIDLFEARPPHSPGLKLKDAHRKLKKTGVHVQLIPGDPLSALARSANTLLGTDLIVIRGDQAPEALQRSWLYVPRMLHDRSVILQESNSDGAVHFATLSRDSIEQLASASSASRRAA
jgi:predicted O-methyltransferase YrrM